MNKISVVIPCYNYSAYLSEAIESCLAQTLPCDILVVDDGEVIVEIGFDTGPIDTYGEFYNLAIPYYFECIDQTIKAIENV